jgi:hypothetical protein
MLKMLFIYTLFYHVNINNLYTFALIETILLPYLNKMKMLIEPVIFDIARVACSGVIIVAAAYYLVKSDVDRYLKVKAGNRDSNDRQYLLSLKLQAHERLILFAERINPVNLLVMLHDKQLSKSEMHGLLLEQVRSEYQHNVSQQLYVSSHLWDAVDRLKTDTLSLINNTARTLPDDAGGTALSRQILARLAEIDERPYETAQALIKTEIQQIF